MQEEAQDHVTVKPYRAKSVEKKKCCVLLFLHVLLLLDHFTCDIQLPEFKLLEICQFT